MTPLILSQQEKATEAKVSRRDWIVMPALGLLAVLLLAGATELLARTIFPGFSTAGEDCIVKDLTTGARGIPHSVCWEKIPESEPTQYRYNSSGYRADHDFGPKQAGEYRIVMLGTSFTIGMRLPLEKTFAATLPAQLSQRIGRPVEIYNEAIPFRYPDVIASDFDEFVKSQPDLILWTVNVGDLQKEGAVPPADNFRNLSLMTRAWQRLRTALAQGSIAYSLSEVFSHTRTTTLLLHFMYTSQSEFVKTSLVDVHKVPYLVTQPDPDWQKHLAEFDKSATEIVARAKAANVPLVVVYLPNHVQSAMISMGEWPAGFDPYELDHHIESIVTSHGGTFIDVMPDMAKVARPDLGYFLVEGHPNARGQATFSNLLAQQLTSGVVPALRAAPASRLQMKSER